MRRLSTWLLLLAILLAACEGGKPQSSASTTTSSTTSTSTSTSTTAPPAASAASPVLSSEFGQGAYLEGTERWLTAPAEPTTKRVTGTCDGIDDPGWESDCQHAKSRAGEATAVHERQGVQERVLIYVKRGPARWDLALWAADDTGKEFDATIGTVDPMGDGNEKFLVKLRAIDQDPNDGLGEPPLQADLIEPSGMIVVHVVLLVGREGHPDARALPSQGLEVVDCTINCVPTGPVRVRLIAYRDGAWRVVREGCRGPTCSER